MSPGSRILSGCKASETGRALARAFGLRPFAFLRGSALTRIPRQGGENGMKTQKLGMALAMALATLTFGVASPATANCDNYGNQVNVGSTTNCNVSQNYCDGGGSGAGSGAGAGAGGGVDTGANAGASASAGATTTCCQSGCGNTNSTASDEPGTPTDESPELPQVVPLPAADAGESFAPLAATLQESMETILGETPAAPPEQTPGLVPGP